MASSIVQSVLRYYLLNENNLFVAVGWNISFSTWRNLFNVLFPCLVQDSMVVCRLRKNNEFHLNDTPGNQWNDLAVTNGTVDLSRAVQLNGLGLINGGECCSKEASSSFSSHSVEQIEFGSESDKLNKELPQHHSSSHWKVLLLPPFYTARLLTSVSLIFVGLHILR